MLFSLPYAVIAVSVVTALFPRMSRSASLGHRGEVANTLAGGLTMSATLLVRVLSMALTLSVLGGASAMAADLGPTSPDINPERFGWSGAYGTHFWVDPKEKIVAVMMTQTSNNEARADFETAVMQALVGFLTEECCVEEKEKSCRPNAA